MAGGVKNTSPMQGDEPDQKAATPELDKDALFLRLQRWFKEDRDHCEKWHKTAAEEYAIVAGDQWDEEAKRILEDQGRAPIVFNQVEAVINAVKGQEVANRQEVRYIPRQATTDPNQGADATKVELYTEAARWFRDMCDAEHEESNAFGDTAAVGMGWIETRIDYEESTDGEPKIERINPLEMLWDSKARKTNLTDARRIWRRRCDVPIEEARSLFPDAEDEDLDASWAGKDGLTEDPHDSSNPRYDGDGREESGIAQAVTLIQVQWKEKEPYYSAALFVPPMQQSEMKDLAPEEYRKALERGMVQKGVKRTRTVLWEAFVGAKVLDAYRVVSPISDKPCADFKFQCITGTLDQKTGQFYGLVRSMADPQRFANKMLSATIQIVTTNANGGLMMEQDAVEDINDFENNWARPDKPTYFKKGALSSPNGPKVQPKPMANLPTAHMNLMEFGINSIPRVSGVNYEMLGLRDAQQASSLEYQRRQSGLTILAPLFDSLRRYRKIQGRLLLYFITEYLSDGRLVRITGDVEGYVPLLRQPGSIEYDVIVDDAPTSPNQKEATWAFLQQILPVIGKGMTREEMLVILEDSPLPPSRLAKLKQLGQKAADQPPPPDPALEKMKAELELKQQSAQLDAQIKQQEAQLEAMIARERAANDMEIAREKAKNDMIVARYKAHGDRQLKGLQALSQATMAQNNDMGEGMEGDDTAPEMEGMGEPDMSDPAMNRIADALSQMAQAIGGLAQGQAMNARALEMLAEGQAETRAVAKTILANRQARAVQ